MRTGTETSRRGRPPAYDRAAAVEAIRSTFWATGFSATSLDQIAAATGMTRPSLYAAFGDKAEMYLGAVASMAEDMRALAETTLSHPDLRIALTGFFAGCSEVYGAGAAGRGCLVVCTSPSEALTDARVQGVLAAVVQATDAAFEARLRQARSNAETAPTPDETALARLLTAVLHSLAIRARAGGSRDALAALYEPAVDLVCAVVTPTGSTIGRSSTTA